MKYVIVIMMLLVRAHIWAQSTTHYCTELKLKLSGVDISEARSEMSEQIKLYQKDILAFSVVPVFDVSLIKPLNDSITQSQILSYMSINKTETRHNQSIRSFELFVFDETGIGGSYMEGRFFPTGERATPTDLIYEAMDSIDACAGIRLPLKYDVDGIVLALTPNEILVIDCWKSRYPKVLKWSEFMESRFGGIEHLIEFD